MIFIFRQANKGIRLETNSNSFYLGNKVWYSTFSAGPYLTQNLYGSNYFA